MSVTGSEAIREAVEPLLALVEERARGRGTEALDRAVRALLARERAWGSHAIAPAPGRPYGRRSIVEVGGREAMLARWRSGAASAVHDHGGARGAVVVLEGAFEERQYAFDGRALALSSSRPFVAGAWIEVLPETIHAMHAVGGGLSLHLYVGVATPVRLFDPAARRTWTLRSGGAWLPPDDPITSEAWPSP